MEIKILNKQTQQFVSHYELERVAGIDSRAGIEDVGLQSDGTPVVFGRRNDFQYLDPNIYQAVIITDGS